VRPERTKNSTDPAENFDMADSQPNLIADLTKRLQTWRTMQIEYYADKKLHSQEYPPVLPISNPTISARM
jgi:hypothetical protein